MPRNLINIAKELRPIVIKAVDALGSDLQGYSVIDLVADNIQDVSISDIKCALVVAGVDNLLTPRLIRSYSK